MIRRKVWNLTGNSHNFAPFQRMFRSRPSNRPSTRTQVRIGGESPKVHIDQSAFVVHRKGIPSDHSTRARGRRGRWSLSSDQHPIRRGETGYRCGINAVSRARTWNQIMAVPTSQTDRTAIGRRSSRTNSRSPARRSILRAVANQIGIVVRNPSRVARWLNIVCAYRRVNRDFLFKIADRDIERAASQQIG